MRADLYPGETPARWARSLDRWCAERGFDLAAQTSVNFFRCPWEFDLMTEAYQLRRSLGRALQFRALQFRADVRRFAALMVYRLGQRFALALDPRPPAPRRVRGGAPARLRRRREGRLAERRAGQLRRPDGRAPRAGRRREPVRYLRHDGQRGDLARFADKAWEQRRVNVSSKAALVDYEVLLKCSRFGGFTKSSHS